MNEKIFRLNYPISNNNKEIKELKIKGSAIAEVLEFERNRKREIGDLATFLIFISKITGLEENFIIRMSLSDVFELQGLALSELEKMTNETFKSFIQNDFRGLDDLVMLFALNQTPKTIKKVIVEMFQELSKNFIPEPQRKQFSILRA